MAVTFQGAEVRATTVLPAVLEVTGTLYHLGIKFLLFYFLLVETVCKNCNFFVRIFLPKCKEETSDLHRVNL